MKKHFVLFLVVVLVLGFAACVKKPKSGDPVSIVEHETNEIWRGVVTGDVQTFAEYALIKVRSPEDNPTFFFEMFVISQEFGNAAQDLKKTMQVGKEIYFYRTYVDSRDPASFSGSWIGLIRRFPSSNQKIMNPPLH